MDFSIIVPARNEAETIGRCVASLYAVDYSPTEYEVLVVDNGSTDETARAAVQSGARVISEPEPNRCRARNAGAKVARGQWLVYTDSDCEADPGWLKALAEARDHYAKAGELDRIGALAGAILAGPAESHVEAYIARREWLDQEKFLRTGRPHSPPFAATANLAIRADVFEQIGGFDDQLWIAGEDADWCWRAAAADFEIRYVPDAKIIHHHRATVGALLRQAYNYGLGNADLFAKHRERWGASASLEWRRYGWAAKGLLRSPWCAIAGSDAVEKRLGWYDFLSNSAQAFGRLRGGLKHKLPII